MSTEFETPMDLMREVAMSHGKSLSPNLGYGDDRSLEGGDLHPEIQRAMGNHSPAGNIPPMFPVPSENSPPAYEDRQNARELIGSATDLTILGALASYRGQTADLSESQQSEIATIVLRSIQSRVKAQLAGLAPKKSMARESGQVPKSKGRPKGSKNKPKPEAT